MGNTCIYCLYVSMVQKQTEIFECFCTFVKIHFRYVLIIYRVHKCLEIKTDPLTTFFTCAAERKKVVRRWELVFILEVDSSALSSDALDPGYSSENKTELYLLFLHFHLVFVSNDRVSDEHNTSTCCICFWWVLCPFVCRVYFFCLYISISVVFIALHISLETQ